MKKSLSRLELSLALMLMGLLIFVGWMLWVKKPWRGADDPLAQKKQTLSHHESLTLVTGGQNPIHTANEKPVRQNKPKNDKLESQTFKPESFPARQPQQEATSETDPKELNLKEEEDYSEQDEIMNYGLPLEMIGIPRYFETSSLGYQPTEADEQRVREIETEVRDALDIGLLSLEAEAGYIPIDVDPDETVYVHPDYLSDYEALLEENQTIHERSMRRVPGQGYMLAPDKSRKLPDGTLLRYYRRRDGSLIRSVTKPDGTVRKWVIGWTDLTPYAADAAHVWQDE